MVQFISWDFTQRNLNFYGELFFLATVKREKDEELSCKTAAKVQESLHELGITLSEVTTLMKTSRPKMALFPLMVVFSINKQSFFDAIVSS